MYMYIVHGDSICMHAYTLEEESISERKFQPFHTLKIYRG